MKKTQSPSYSNEMYVWYWGDAHDILIIIRNMSSLTDFNLRREGYEKIIFKYRRGFFFN